MSSLDGTIVATALHAMQHGLHSSINWTSWTITGYSVGMVLALSLAGKLSERYGRRRFFLISVVVFATASLCCGLATNIYVLIALRAVQAAGGAGFTPSATGIVVEHFGSARDKAVGLFGSIFPIGSMIGPIFGGLFVTYWSWRGIFFVNVPIGVLLIVLCLKIRAPRSRAPRPRASSDRLERYGVPRSRHLVLDAGHQRPRTRRYARLVAAIHQLRHRRGSRTWPIRAPHPTCARPLHRSASDRRTWVWCRQRNQRLVRRGGRRAHGARSALRGQSVPDRCSWLGNASHRRGDSRNRDVNPRCHGASPHWLPTAALRRLSRSRRWHDGARAPPVGLSAYAWLASASCLVGIGAGYSSPASRNAGLQLAPDQSASLAALRSTGRQAGAIASISITTAILAQAANPGAIQAKVFVVFAVLLIVALPVIARIPEHRGSW